MENRIINLSTSLYEDIVNNMFSNYQKHTIIDEINDKFNEYLRSRGRQYNYIESLIYDLYFSEIENFKSTLKRKYEDRISTHIDILLKKVKSDPNNTSEDLKYFRQMINPKYEYNLFEEINNDFVSDFTRKLMNKFDRIDNRIEEIIRYDLMYEIKKYLNDFSQRIVEEHNEQVMILSNTITNIVEEDIDKMISKEEKKSNDEIMPKKEIQSTNEELINLKIDIYNEYTQLFGYSIINENNKIVLINNKYQEKYELKSISSGLMSNTNDKVGIILENDKIFFYDPIKMKKNTYNNFNFRSEYIINDKNSYEIKFNDGILEFLYNDEILNTPEKQIVIIEYLENDYPQIYNQFISNSKINNKFTQIQKTNLYKVENNQIIINPDKYEELEKRLYIMGYKIEIENGILYGINKDGIKDKIINKHGYLSFENNPKIKISANLTLISNKIVTNYMEIWNGYNHLMVSPEFNAFYFNGENPCSIIIKDNVIKYESETMDENQIKEFFNKNYPNVMLFINSNKKWNEFTIPKEENIDLDQISSKFKSIEKSKKELSNEELLAKIAELQKENQALKLRNQELKNQISMQQDFGPTL